MKTPMGVKWSTSQTTGMTNDATGDRANAQLCTDEANGLQRNFELLGAGPLLRTGACAQHGPHRQDGDRLLNVRTRPNWYLLPFRRRQTGRCVRRFLRSHVHALPGMPFFRWVLTRRLPVNLRLSAVTSLPLGLHSIIEISASRHSDQPISHTIVTDVLHGERCGKPGLREPVRQPDARVLDRATDPTCLRNVAETQSVIAFPTPSLFYNLRDHVCPTARIALSTRTAATMRNGRSIAPIQGSCVERVVLTIRAESRPLAARS